MAEPGALDRPRRWAAGWTLLSVGDTQVRTVEQLVRVLAEHAVGDAVRLRWTGASGAGHSATATLGRAPVG